MGVRVLIIDDSPEWRSAPSRILRITGESSMIRTLTPMLFNLASEGLSALETQA